jgi:hypothetical protein
MAHKDFSKMLQYCNDADPELRDVLVMLAREVERQAAEIERIQAQMKRVNEAQPNTALRA